MARPNSANAIAGHIQGLREAKAAFQRLPAALREELNEATELTLKLIVSRARSRVITSPSIQTRALLNAIGYSLNKKSGRGRAGITAVTTKISVGSSKIRIKGFLVAGKGGSASTAKGARLIRPSRYAHFIEFGTRRQRAEPFMIPATEQSKAAYLSACRDAGQRLEQWAVAQPQGS